MNPTVGVASVLPLSIALVVLLELAGFGVIAWIVPISVAVALVGWALFVGWRSRQRRDSSGGR